MSLNVAIESAVLTVQAPVTGTAQFISPASTKVKAAGEGVLVDQTQVEVAAGATNGSCTSSAPAIAPMPATSTKVLVEGDAPLRVDDEVTISGVPGTTGGGSGCTLDITVKITDAGQDKVRAE